MSADGPERGRRLRSVLVRNRTLRAVAAASAVVMVAVLAVLTITLHVGPAAVNAGSDSGDTAAASALAPAISLPPLTDPEPGPLPLHVDGNRLVNSAGTTVVLHGADMSGTEFVCVQGWTGDPFGGQPEDDPATFAAMKSWGIDVVRIPLNEDCWLGINGVRIGGTAYRQPVIELVRNLEHSRRFLLPRIVGENSESTGGPGEKMEAVSASNRVNFDLLADYNPLSAGEKRLSPKLAKLAEENPGTESTARRVAHPGPGSILVKPSPRSVRQPYAGPAVPGSKPNAGGKQ